MGDRTGAHGKKTSHCAGCGGAIHDQYILRVSPDLEWHAACLRCAECNQFLDETCTCFVRDSKTYCKSDYVRLFGTKCEKCGDGFRKTDFVMRAKDKIYHVECFRCALCERQLVPGDEFALTEHGLFCKDDHQTDKLCENNNNNTKVAALDLKQEAATPKSSVPSPSADSSDATVSSKRERKTGDSKTTRVRTVLNEKQLHTLRTCYNANPRPDALMKEQLVEMTGLSPRVVRVWFQNKRCKDKKREIYLKQMQEQGKSGGRFGAIGQMQAIPLVASSPVRHGSPLPAHMVDVQTYQPPWKALTEFALNTDLERLDPNNPAFQQLASQMHGFCLEGGAGPGSAPVPTSQPPAFGGDTDPLRYSTPDELLVDCAEQQSDLSSHSD
ncbi:insulin gene enhancer protein isl-1-like [Amphibalanus amphitrite]|uniref:insulin gene enhancer protein isl-1-like n=1 Tax=Amphibalanus amphitrite TaxID=1232801 RepID=UPI001C9232E9|nr:insulin gene enhancer protein isl-1-like [Amphibalanus amphitrite]